MKSESKFALLRITFGCVWAIDAWFKWQPAFLNGLVDILKSMLSGQQVWVQAWINLWIHIVNFNPHLFAVLIAVTETIIAFCLIFGFFTRLGLAISVIFSLLIWSIAEGFGGPYIAGSTDIGCAIIYAFVAIALWLGVSWRMYSIDSLLQKKYPTFFLWKDIAPIQQDKKDHITSGLLFIVIVLVSIILAGHTPITSPQAMGPGAMAPQGMILKTYDLKSSDPIPTVDFDITRDPVGMGGWDVHIITTNFTFTPQNVNQPPVPDQGHVHIYVDDTMYVVYGPWYHLDDLSAGSHVITVSLFANDHSIFSKDGNYIEVKKTITQ